MQFTRSQWEKILKAEKARGEGKRGERTRVTLVRWLERKLNGSGHPAIQVYHEEMGRFPRKNQFDAIIERVGTERLDFWRKVVRAWKLHGWNPYNLAGMLECYDENRVPKTGGNNGGSGRSSGAYDSDYDSDRNAFERQRLTEKERQRLEQLTGAAS
jgi:hypothetical protein